MQFRGRWAHLELGRRRARPGTWPGPLGGWFTFQDMGDEVRYGIKLSGQDTTIEALRDVWRIADEGGFDHCWVFDHLAAIGGDTPDRPVFEGWSLQAAMAAATTRVRIGCLVTGNTYRHPALLAKIATTVDHLSGGRLEFGLGAAWATVEHEMLGLPGLDHRVGRLSEALQVIRSLWTDERTSFDGRYYQLQDAIANPKPVQKPHPPIWIGAGGEQTLRLTARHADVWNLSGGGGHDRFAALSAQLDDACSRIGRDPREIRRSVQTRWDGASREQLLDDVGGYVTRGATDVVIYPGGAEAVRVAGLVTEQLDALRGLAKAPAG